MPTTTKYVRKPKVHRKDLARHQEAVGDLNNILKVVMDLSMGHTAIVHQRGRLPYLSANLAVIWKRAIFEYNRTHSLVYEQVEEEIEPETTDPTTD